MAGLGGALRLKKAIKINNNMLIRYKRLFFIWKAGKLPLAKKMKAWLLFRRMYFAYWGFYPMTTKQVNDFLTGRYEQVKLYDNGKDFKKMEW